MKPEVSDGFGSEFPSEVAFSCIASIQFNASSSPDIRHIKHEKLPLHV